MVDIKYLSELANLNVNSEEAKRLEKQLEEIIGFVSKLGKVNTDDVELYRNPVDLIHDKHLSDETNPSLPVETALYDAPSKHNNYFSVDLILKNKKIK